MTVGTRGISVLLTFAGRKSHIVQIFAQSARTAAVVAVDSDPHASAQFHASAFEVAPSAGTHPERYVSFLLGVCEAYGIDAVIPQNDVDLPLLARAFAEFASAGARVLGAPPEVVEAVADKLSVADWMAKRNLPYPETWAIHDAPEAVLPAIVKSRTGQGSAGLHRIDHPQLLNDLRGEELVVQREISGTEYNLDILRSAEGQVLSVVPKVKLEMRHGSTQAARSVESAELIQFGGRIGEAVEHVGSIDVDVIVDSDGHPWVVDINPRIGGGFPFTALFAPRYVDALLEIAGGRSPAPFLGEYAMGIRADREYRFYVAPTLSAP